MSVHEEYIARIESIAGVSREILNSLSPREIWKKFHGNSNIKVESFFPMVGGGGSVIHSVSTSESINTEVDLAIASLGR
jgi:hypothetical protein